MFYKNIRCVHNLNLFCIDVFFFFGQGFRVTSHKGMQFSFEIGVELQRLYTQVKKLDVNRFLRIVGPTSLKIFLNEPHTKYYTFCSTLLTFSILRLQKM